jgi:alkanesulfonate monooxygenase SsuD/methylene tetrahydromethanopterin reductase-like flavin-dependent oxidoreductase (luciferase family)
LIPVGVFDHLDRGTLPLSGFYEQRLAIVEAYDRAGFFCYHLAEHHATPIGTAPSPSLFLSAVAQRTKRLRFGPLVYLLPFYHPLRLIEEICMLDQLSGGRLEIGTGRGISPVEARLYGLDPNESQARYDEALEILRRGLASDVLSFAGTYYRFDAVPMALEPVQKPMPPFWLGVHSPESAERAARAGAGAVTNEGTSRARAVAERYRAAWLETGAPEAMPKIGIVRFVVAADSDAEALRIGRRAYRRWHESFYFLHRKYGMRATHEKSPSFDDALEEGTAFAGTPETLAGALRAHLDETRANYLVGQFAFGDLTLEETLRTIALFRDHVLPALEPVSR